MTTTTGPRPMTDAEKEAFTLHLQKVPVPTIQARTGLVPSQIAAAVDLGQVHSRLAMKSSTAVLLEAPAQPKPPAVTVKSAAAAPTVGDERISVGRLLTWAEETGPSKAKTLAARIRVQLDELRTIHAENDARVKAQAEVNRLTAELETAKAKLRAAGAGGSRTSRPAGAVPAPDRKEFLTTVRAWAAANGHAVNPLGRIPAHIMEAYRASTGDDR